MGAVGTENGASRYRLLEELGRGGMGVVYRAEEVALGRQVALKALPESLAGDPEWMARFRREARILASLTHPCFVNVFGIEEIEGRSYLAMELVEGTPLDRLIPPLGFPLDRFFRLAIPLADAIGEAHHHGVVHRDLKPGNLIVTPERRIKILDFGLARRLDGPGSADARTETMEPVTEVGTVTGTAGFMAPEVLRGAPADERSDIFALGVVLFLMATGRHPFDAGNASGPDLMTAILRDEPPALGSFGGRFPRQLDQVVHSCLEKDPERRFQSAKDLRLQLELLEAELATGEPPAVAAPAAPLRSRRRWLLPLVVGVGVALVAIVIGVIAAYRDGTAGAGGRQLYVEVRPYRAFSGAGQEGFRDGFVRVFEERLAGLEGVWMVPADGDPRPDFVIETDVRRTGDAVNLSFQVRDREERTVGTEALSGSAADPYDLLDRAGGLVAEVVASRGGQRVEYRRRAAPTRDPGAFDAYLGALAAEGSDAGRTLALVRQAIRSDPRFAGAHALAGTLLLDRSVEAAGGRDAEAAAGRCRRAVELDPGLADGHVCLGRVLRRRGELAAAERALLRAIELRPDRITAYEELIGVFAAQGEPDRAQDVWREVIAAHPGFWAGHWALGRFHAASNRLEEAVDDYLRALEVAPANSTVYWYLGAAHFLLGRYEEAIVAYQSSLAVRPTYQAYSNVGHVYLQFRRFSEAIEAFEAAAAFGREECRILGNLAAAYSLAPGREGEVAPALDRAIARCREELTRSPRDPSLWAWLAYDQAMQGRADESLESLRRALELQPNDAHFLYFAARVHHLLGDRAAALDALERAVRGGYPVAEIRLSPELDDLRDAPEIRRLLDAAGRE